MSRERYDEEASQRLNMDVVYEVADVGPIDPLLWVEAMRRLNSIDDPLARKIVELHRDCGSGDGVCDAYDHEDSASGADWACETMSVVAAHFGVKYPARQASTD